MQLSVDPPPVPEGRSYRSKPSLVERLKELDPTTNWSCLDFKTGVFKMGPTVYNVPRNISPAQTSQHKRKHKSYFGGASQLVNSRGVPPTMASQRVSQPSTLETMYTQDGNAVFPSQIFPGVQPLHTISPEQHRKSSEIYNSLMPPTMVRTNRHTLAYNSPPVRPEPPRGGGHYWAGSRGGPRTRGPGGVIMRGGVTSRGMNYGVRWAGPQEHTTGPVVYPINTVRSRRGRRPQWSLNSDRHMMMNDISVHSTPPSIHPSRAATNQQARVVEDHVSDNDVMFIKESPRRPEKRRKTVSVPPLAPLTRDEDWDDDPPSPTVDVPPPPLIETVPDMPSLVRISPIEQLLDAPSLTLSHSPLYNRCKKGGVFVLVQEICAPIWELIRKFTFPPPKCSDRSPESPKNNDALSDLWKLGFRATPFSHRSREKIEGTRVCSVLALVGVGAGIKSLSHLVN
eukprot:sb/3464572/